MKILIVDDDENLRAVMGEAFRNDADFTILEAADGRAALDVFKTEKPDVVLLDLKMPGMSGIETLQKLLSIDRHVPVVMLTAYGDVPTAVEAMKCGAHDFVTKPVEFSKLKNLLKNAVMRRKELEKSASRRAGARQSANVPSTLYDALTDREREILRLTARGMSSTKISALLSISPRTVETHRTNLMQKLELRNRSEIIRFAFRCGILKIET